MCSCACFAYIIKGEEKNLPGLLSKIVISRYEPFPFVKAFWEKRKARPGQLGDHIPCNSNSSKFRRQSNHKKDANCPWMPHRSGR